MLREDLGLTMQEMADATGRSVAEYAAQESGEEDLSFTFLYKCADTPIADGKEIPIADGFKSQMLAVAAKGMYYGGGIKAT
ncbi:MAG: helix-turn-helix transcriptional regulator, partial [Eggerthellaceae bacterium]|nr:helix-turn-helix transcriptional regulator [Eggerthellaceae bacterium]